MHDARPGESTRELAVVDPTCGSGALLVPAARAGMRVYGVELDPAVAGEAAKRLGTVPGGRIKVGNALLDPIGPRGWPEFVAKNREILSRMADRRGQESYDEAERLAGPLRESVVRGLPGELRGRSPFCWPLEFPEVFLTGGFDVVLTNPPWDKLKLHARECFDADLRRLHETEQRRVRAAAVETGTVGTAIENEKRALAIFRAWLRARREENDGASMRGDANAYLAILDLAHDLLRPHGALGAIVPGGLWTDMSALGWRQRLFDAYLDVSTWGFDARTDAFPDIDQRTAVLVGRKQQALVCCQVSAGEHPASRERDQAVVGGTPVIRVHAGLSGLSDLDCRAGFPVPVSLISRTAPESLAVPPLSDALDAAIVEKLYRMGPPFAAGRWQPVFGREIDMTLDADLFDGVVAGVPLWEGKRIGAFELCPVDAVRTGALPGCKAGCSRAGSCPFERRNGQQLWVDESRLGGRDRGHAGHSRVAWRSVARADRARRLEAALVPAGYRLGNSLNYLTGDRQTLVEKLTLLALLNSLVVEWRFRQLSNNNNVNLFAIRQLPLPEEADPTLARLAGALMLADPRFASASLPAFVPETSTATSESRSSVRLKLEAAVAHRFGLSGLELTRILSGFPKLHPSDAAAIVGEFEQTEDRTKEGEAEADGRGNQASGRAALGRAR